jgi:branched-chain amino acid transport system permease protein
MRKEAIKAIAIAAFAILLFALPEISSEFFTTMMIRIMYYGLMAVAFSFLAGQLGLFSLMVPTSFALSGYTIAILESRHILFFPYSALLGILVAMTLSALFGFLVNRSKGTYFLMLTLVLGQLVWALILQWVSLTKGTNGISGIKTPAFMASPGKNANLIFYYCILGVTLACVLALHALIKSSFGLKLRGIKESESRMVMLGYNVSLLKWLAFMIAAFLSSLSGIFFVYFTGLVNPDSINLNAANQIMISAIFGGTGSIAGALVGTAIIKTLEIVLSGITQRYLLIIGVVFLIVIVFMPGGIVMLSRRLKSAARPGTAKRGIGRGAAEDAGEADKAM